MVHRLIMANWGFLSNHARVPMCIAHDPGARLRDIAASLGITECSAHGIAADLAGPARPRPGRRPHGGDESPAQHVVEHDRGAVEHPVSGGGEDRVEVSGADQAAARRGRTGPGGSPRCRPGRHRSHRRTAASRPRTPPSPGTASPGRSCGRCWAGSPRPATSPPLAPAVHLASARALPCPQPGRDTHRDHRGVTRAEHRDTVSTMPPPLARTPITRPECPVLHAHREMSPRWPLSAAINLADHGWSQAADRR